MAERRGFPPDPWRKLFNREEGMEDNIPNGIVQASDGAMWDIGSMLEAIYQKISDDHETCWQVPKAIVETMYIMRQFFCESDKEVILQWINFIKQQSNLSDYEIGINYFMGKKATGIIRYD